MAANKKFTPRASSNLIEEEVTDKNPETPVEEVTAPVDEAPADVTEEVATPEETPEVSANEEAPAEEEKKTETVTFTAETEKKPIERKVKICLAKKYDGCIGGEWYHFAKDQVVTVPENVKRILNSKEGMLKPL